MRLIHTSSLILLALALAACGGDKPATGAATPAAGKQPEWTDAARIEAIASTLQACSYEGNPVKVEASQLQGATAKAWSTRSWATPACRRISWSPQAPCPMRPR